LPFYLCNFVDFHPKKVPLNLKKLSLLNYKNIADVHFSFDAKIHCFVGQNGVGKTNILDAIYHLALGKSFFNTVALQNIKHGEEFYMIEGEFEKEERLEHIVCSVKKGQKKLIKRNNKPYEKLSEHLGFLSVVMISPADTDLITDGSETRRKFMDSVIAQLNPTYLQEIISYQKVLSQRNALLKYFANNQTFDSLTLGIYNDQLAELGLRIFHTREEFIVQFVPIFNQYHQRITNKAEAVQIVYESQLKEHSFLELLETSVAKDKVLQYTSVGIHKDDLSFEIDAFPIKKFGSQGQQKSFLIALKLAQFDFLSQKSGHKPILLLDDIFDKLDAFRVERLVQMVNEDLFGQIFISDTHDERTEEVVKKTHQSYQIIRL
jgi:DNA replication and repair protein RecF